MTENVRDESLDMEWMELIEQALEAGIEVEEIRKFLKETSLMVEG